MKNYCPIADYGLIGNLHTAALVSKSGSLDFMSYPRFDSATVFAKLLDAENGGAWSIHPDDVEGLHVSQYYEPDTAILVTRFMHTGGVFELTDFMPPVEEVEHCQVVRIARAVVGKTRVRFRLKARYPYAAEDVTAQSTETDGPLKFDLGPNTVQLYGARAGDADSGSAVVDFAFTLDVQSDPEDSRRAFVFQSESCHGPGDAGVAGFGESLLAYSREYWSSWVGKIEYSGGYRPTIMRSAITLKLCTSAQFGSSVAAPTFGLPELLGGELNWDYRYSWIRDSAFSMFAMLRLGLKEESRQFISWIEDRCKELKDAADLGLMYRVDGTTDLDEYELPLEGYRGSSPVRVGNGAAGQHQLDIYGELIDTIYLYDGHAHEITYAFWQDLTQIIDYVCEQWRSPDHGIWEERGKKKHYTMSKVMAWVAIDRGIRIAEHRGFPAPIQKWTDERNAIYERIYEEHYNKSLGSWTEHPESERLDGSLLMMPLVRFVAPEEPLLAQHPRADRKSPGGRLSRDPVSVGTGAPPGIRRRRRLLPHLQHVVHRGAGEMWPGRHRRATTDEVSVVRQSSRTLQRRNRD